MVRIGPSAHSQFPGMENSGDSIQKTTVQPGEIKLAHVATRLNLATEHLSAVNPKVSPDGDLKVGQEINIPASIKQTFQSPEKPGGGATGQLTAAADKNFQAGLLRDSLQQFAGIADTQTRPSDPADLPPAPPDLGKGVPLDLGLRPDLQVPPPIHPPDPPPPPPDDLKLDDQGIAYQRPPRPQTPPDPPPDDGRLSMKQSLPSFTNPAMHETEGEEEANETYPSPDGGRGGYHGLPKRPDSRVGIGLPQPPSAGPDIPRPEEAGGRTPGNPVNPGPDDPRFAVPTPPTPPGEPDTPDSLRTGDLNLGQKGAAGWQTPLGPDQPRPETSGIGGGGAPPSPPPDPDKSGEPR